MVCPLVSDHGFLGTMTSLRGGRTSFGDRGRSTRGRVQCQICGRLGNLAQRCYYRFDRQFDGPPGLMPSRAPHERSPFIETIVVQGTTPDAEAAAVAQKSFYPDPKVAGYFSGPSRTGTPWASHE